MEFYLKKNTKHRFHQASFFTQEVDQDPRTDVICNLSKTPTKPTCNIETKTNNTTLVVNPNLNAKQL